MSAVHVCAHLCSDTIEECIDEILLERVETAPTSWGANKA